jgi:hypothetical protein
MATSTRSFKQQCPSCEAMVPIRDPGLIGRKIDCPRCKYRFVVEEPEQEEESPKQGKKGKEKAGPKGKGGPGRRRDGDNDRPAKKEKKGSSVMLLLGIGLAVVAVVALGVVGIFFFLGDDGSSGGGLAGGSPGYSDPGLEGAPGGPGEGEQPNGGPGSKTPVDLGPVAEDITNLLPNDTQAVVSVPLNRVRGSALRQAALENPGTFQPEAFRATFGFPLDNVERVVIAANFDKGWIFSVVRTNEPISEGPLVSRLQGQREAPIKGQAYYKIAGTLDSVSNLLFKAAQPRDSFLLHPLDSRTLVFADPQPMRDFLEASGKPKRLSQAASPPPPPATGGNSGGGFPGEPTEGEGPPGSGDGFGGPPPGYSGGPGSSGGPPGSSGGPPPGYSGGPPGAPGSGSFPGSTGEANSKPTRRAQPASYMTIDPDLKKMMDKVEKRDQKGNPTVLLACALEASNPTLLDAINEAIQKPLIAPVIRKNLGPDKISTVMDKAREVRIVGFSITDFSEARAAFTAAAQLRNQTLAKEIEPLGKDALALAGPWIKENLGLNIKIGAPRPNTPTGYPPGEYPPGEYPPGEYPPGEYPPGEGGEGFPPSYPEPGSPDAFPPGSGGFPPGSGGPPPGYTPPGYPGSEMPGESGTTRPTVEKPDGNLFFNREDDTLVLTFSVNLRYQSYQNLKAGASGLMLVLKGQADLASKRWRIFDLAAATQRYLAAKKHFPQGALPRDPQPDRGLAWRPDQRLSWMVELLPYLSSGNFQYLPVESNLAWNEGSNQFAGGVVIPEFLAQDQKGLQSRYAVYLMGPGNLAGGAATHFVGIAGVGLDAASYDKDDPAVLNKLGIFGYDRITKPEDIKDGLDKTILLLQIPTLYNSPWIAGGGGTVRGVSEEFDAIEPFVSAEYKGKRGTFAIMADGKVRFIPADIDPNTFRALCTIAGGEELDLLSDIAPEVRDTQRQATPTPTPVGGIVPPTRPGGIVPPPPTPDGSVPPPPAPAGEITPPTSSSTPSR